MTADATTGAAGPPIESEDRLLRAVIEELAALDRLAGTTGEYRGAQLLRDRLEAAGATNARIEPATFLAGWAHSLALALTIPILTGLIGPRSRSRAGLALGVGSIVVGGLVAEDIANGPRLLRRTLRRRRATTNVVAEVGDPQAPVTLVVLAHHDAARTGLLFDQTLQQAIFRRFPDFIEGQKTSPPQWAPAFLAPVLVGVGVLAGLRRVRNAGTVLSTAALLVLANIARGAVVPGANDNLSAVGVLVALAERLRRAPVDGVRVLLVSAGAEEELQGGIYGFLADHGRDLDPASTWFLVPDTVGSKELWMLEGEGPVAIEDYTDPAFRDLVADVAAERGVALQRGLRSRFSTDGVVTSRAGFPTAVLVSLEPWRAPANYHLPTDTPENLDYATITATVDLAEALARRLAR